MTVTLAFYKGRGKTAAERILDSAIRLATRGVYSHVELIPGDAVFGRKETCLSSSGRDGGVRERLMVLQPESWDKATLPMKADGPCGFIRKHIGARYDILGYCSHKCWVLGVTVQTGGSVQKSAPQHWACLTRSVYHRSCCLIL